MRGVQWGEVTDTTDWSKNSVCEGTVTSLHIHSRLHLQFKDRKHKGNTTEALRGKGWWFWGDPTSLFHAMDKCSFVLCPSAAGEHASSLDPRFPVCSQIQGLLPTLVHCPPAHPSLECREIRQVEHWIPWQSLSEMCCRSWVCSGCLKNILGLSKEANSLNLFSEWQFIGEVFMTKVWFIAAIRRKKRAPSSEHSSIFQSLFKIWLEQSDASPYRKQGFNSSPFSQACLMYNPLTTLI